MEVVENFGRVLVDRSLSHKEEELTKWLLENGGSKGKVYLSQLQDARVVAQRSCGCAGIDFEIGGGPRPHGPLEILGDFSFGSSENHDYCEVFAFAIEGVLAGFEIVEYEDTISGRLPEKNELRII